MNGKEETEELTETRADDLPLSATERYRRAAENRPVTIVDVHAPSGFVFKFQKPSKFALLFGAGELPQIAASEAAAEWQKEAVTQFKDLNEESRLKLLEKTYEIRDKVLLLSVEPKLVTGKAKNENELSTDDVSDEDLDYLFKFVAAGGEQSAMTVMFPEERGKHAFLGSHSKKRRNATK